MKTISVHRPLTLPGTEMYNRSLTFFSSFSVMNPIAAVPKRSAHNSSSLLEPLLDDPNHETPDARKFRIDDKVHIKIQNYDVNIDQKLITVTEDKILLCLDRNMKRLGKKRWIHPLSLLISLLLALATSEFDKLSWVSSELLRATFIVSSFITAGWLITEIMRTARLKEAPHVIDDIFNELRGDELLEHQPAFALNNSVSAWREQS